MCDGRPLASPLFRRLAGRGALFSRFPFRCVLHFVFFLIRGVALHESPSCSGEDSLDEYGRPCDPLSFLLFSALWLRCNQSLLVQETQSAKDLDLTCSTTLLFRDATCLQVGPMSLVWPVNPFGRFDASRPSLLPDVPQRRTTTPCFSSFYSLPLETGCSSYTTADITTYYRVGWMWPLPFRRLAVYYLEHRGLVGSVFSRQRNREFKLKFKLKLKHYLSPGSAWKGRVSSGYPGVGSAISTHRYLST